MTRRLWAPVLLALGFLVGVLAPPHWKATAQILSAPSLVKTLLLANKDIIAVLGPLVSGLGVVVASFGVGVAGLSFRLSAQTAVWNSARDCLWHFNEDWGNLQDVRKQANEAIQAQGPFGFEPDLDDVLNFFDGMAFMGNRGHLDDELAWSYYYDEAHDVWTRAKPYVMWYRTEKQDGTFWIEIEPWLTRLGKINARKKRQHLPPPSNKTPADAGAAVTTPSTKSNQACDTEPEPPKGYPSQALLAVEKPSPASRRSGGS